MRCTWHPLLIGAGQLSRVVQMARKRAINALLWTVQGKASLAMTGASRSL